MFTTKDTNHTKAHMAGYVPTVPSGTKAGHARKIQESEPQNVKQTILDSQEERWFFGVGWVAAVALGWLKLSPLAYGWALRLPMEFGVDMLVGMAGALFAVGVLIVAFVRLVYRFAAGKGLSRLHLKWTLALTALFLVPGDWLHAQGARLRLASLDEESCLRFAREMRASIASETPVTLESNAEEYVRRSRPEYLPPNRLAVIQAGPFSTWPKRMLRVWVTDGSVCLERGSGVLGSMGVEIFDQSAPRQPRGPDAQRDNPYVPVEYRLFGRVFFFTRD